MPLGVRVKAGEPANTHSVGVRVGTYELRQNVTELGHGSGYHRISYHVWAVSGVRVQLEPRHRASVRERE